MENTSNCVWGDMTRRHTKQFNIEAPRRNTKRGYSGSAEQQNSQPLWPKVELLTCVWFGKICVVFAVPESVALAAQVDEFIERAHAGAVAAALGYGRYHAVERGEINVPFADSSATQPSHVIFLMIPAIARICRNNSFWEESTAYSLRINCAMWGMKYFMLIKHKDFSKSRTIL